MRNLYHSSGQQILRVCVSSEFAPLQMRRIRWGRRRANQWAERPGLDADFHRRLSTIFYLAVVRVSVGIESRSLLVDAPAGCFPSLVARAS